MKKLIGLLFIVCFALYGCNSAQGIYLYSDMYVEVFHQGDQKTGNVALLQNYEDYQEYMEWISSGMVSEKLSDKLSMYDENFFGQNMLAIIYHEENSPASEISVRKLEYVGSTLQVTLGRDVNGGEHEKLMEYHAILIEVPSSAACTAVEYYVEEWNSNEWMYSLCLAILLICLAAVVWRRSVIRGKKFGTCISENSVIDSDVTG